MTVEEFCRWAKEHNAQDAPITIEHNDVDGWKRFVGIDDANLSVEDGWIVVDVT